MNVFIKMASFRLKKYSLSYINGKRWIGVF